MLSKEMIVRIATTSTLAVVMTANPNPEPTPALLAVTTPTRTVISDTKPSEVMGLGMKQADSLQEVADGKRICVKNIVLRDSREMVDALDDLMGSIRRQSKAIVEQSLDTAQLIRSHLQHRNKRARSRARQLREKGEQLIVSTDLRETGVKIRSMANQLQVDLKSRSRLARKRAKTLRRSLKGVAKEITKNPEGWYWKVHKEWVEKLSDKVRYEIMDVLEKKVEKKVERERYHNGAEKEQDNSDQQQPPMKTTPHFGVRT